MYGKYKYLNLNLIPLGIVQSTCILNRFRQIALFNNLWAIINLVIIDYLVVTGPTSSRDFSTEVHNVGLTIDK